MLMKKIKCNLCYQLMRHPEWFGTFWNITNSVRKLKKGLKLHNVDVSLINIPCGQWRHVAWGWVRPAGQGVALSRLVAGGGAVGGWRGWHHLPPPWNRRNWLVACCGWSTSGRGFWGRSLVLKYSLHLVFHCRPSLLERFFPLEKILVSRVLTLHLALSIITSHNPEIEESYIQIWKLNTIGHLSKN